MRAVEPAEAGVARSLDGVRIAYEVFGEGGPTIVFLPSAVMDATETEAAVLVGLCRDGVWRAIQLPAAKGVPGMAPPHRAFVRSLAQETVQ